MSASDSLPDAAILEKLLRGELPPEQAEALCDRLQDGNFLSHVAERVSVNDTLVNALETLSATPMPEPDTRLERLMSQLESLRRERAAVPVVATMDQTPPSNPPATGVSPRPLPSFNFLSPPQQEDELGRLGHFRILKLLGQGGMGMVFLAEDITLQRQVALKVMKSDAAQSLDARQRFLREARATAALTNDHVITIHYVGEERDVPFLAMQLLAGESMDKWLELGRKPTVAQVLSLGRDIARGLAAAHEKGLVHRDIKPGNIWLEAPSGRVKILDFGLARSAKDDLQITQSGTILGTPAYMSPEQAQGIAVDHRCDLFSLGAVLYRLLAGRTPFHGDTLMALLRALAVDNPTPLRELAPDVPAPLADLVMRLLSKNPSERPKTANVVVETLQKIERDLESKPRAVRPSTPSAKNPRRRVLIATSVLALIGGLVAGIIIIIKNRDGSETKIQVPDGSDVIVKQTDRDRQPTDGTEKPPAPKQGDSDVPRVGAAKKDSRLYEMRTYHAVPGKLDVLNAQYRACAREHWGAVAKKTGMTVVGCWMPIDNPDSKLIFIFSYPDRDARDRFFREFAADPGWIKATKENPAGGKLNETIEHSFLQATDYSPAIKAFTGEHVFELRTITVSPNHIKALNGWFRDHVLRLFEKYGIKNVGYWVPVKGEEGADETLVFMLAHKSLDAARESIGAVHNDAEWIKVVKEIEVKAGRSLTGNRVKSVFLKATDYSPIK